MSDSSREQEEADRATHEQHVDAVREVSATSRTNDDDSTARTDPLAAQPDVFALLFGASTISSFPGDVRSRWDRLLAQGKRDEALALLCEYAMKQLKDVLGGLMEADGGETLANYCARFLEVQHRFLGIVMQTGAEEAKKKRDRKPKPLNVERDREILRLRVEEKLTFGQIAIRINRWLESKYGRQLKTEEKMEYRAVQAAYNRAKDDTK
jgi:hypothetical protein